tara:strand:+ start:719 stop:838 length:120 start_codon:yes stop_codon:yes gene_type:complete
MVDVNIDHFNGLIDLLMYMTLIVGTFGVAGVVEFLLRKR